MYIDVYIYICVYLYFHISCADIFSSSGDLGRLVTCSQDGRTIRSPPLREVRVAVAGSQNPYFEAQGTCNYLQPAYNPTCNGE